MTTAMIDRRRRARPIARHGSVDAALAANALERRFDLTLSEAVVLGLLRQNVKTFICVFGHGSTELGEVLRVYESASALRAIGVRSEIEAAHAATALRWTTGEKAAVVTSIGPGALQAMAASLAPASDGIGVWHIYGDETTEAEGPNMQQIPKHEQELYLRLTSTMGEAYSLHTPAAVGTALRRGANRVDHPYRAGPFYLLLPLNTQTSMIHGLSIDELPQGAPPGLAAAVDDGSYERAARLLLEAERVVIKVGGGAKDAGPEIQTLVQLVDGVAVLSPLVSGVIPYDHPRNMLVGGTKGSICGNYAMEEADLLLAIGTRAVCQSDCSRTGYPGVQHVINVNAEIAAAMHYTRTVPLVGDAALTLKALIDVLRELGAQFHDHRTRWAVACIEKKRLWEQHKSARYESPTLYDEVWGKKVLTQPAAIKLTTDWARETDAVCFFDAGDVQANGFQIVEDDQLGRTFTEVGASYMGFAVSALLATALSHKPMYGVAVTGDGSFTMAPQILIDGVEHRATGCIVLLDNRRMAAISRLQQDQYGIDYATSDEVAVDYVALARSVDGVLALDGGTSPESVRAALDEARSYGGLSLVHIPVYYGTDELGDLGAYGRWNVGMWSEATQTLRHEIAL